MKMQGYLLTLSTLSAALIGVLAFPTEVRADFKGGDTLKTVIESNWYYSPEGRAVFDNANSRLEYLVKNPVVDNSAFLWWRANEGSTTQSWYIQVDTYLGLLRFPDLGDGAEIGLGIAPSEENGFRFFAVSLNRSKSDYTTYAGISVIDSAFPEWESLTKHRAATLRLHFNSGNKTITPSWNAGNGWRYGQPSHLGKWKMGPSEKFRAVLFGRSRSAGRSGKIVSGQAYFRNFKAGDASPDIVVGRSPIIALQSKKGELAFLGLKTGVEKATRHLSIWNQGTAALSGLKLKVVGDHSGDFTVSGITSRRLSPGDTETFKITFRPQSSGLRKATLVLRSNDPDESAFEIKVSGFGLE